ncbi:MAG: flagellar assembly protein FliH [Chelatococcus sp.]|nr:MAG: flagellar assembly protein FliH [Chelatococcus sp.]
MSHPTKFLFGRDFRDGGRARASDADLATAREQGFHAGMDQARREAQGELNGLVGQLARTAERLFAQEAARATQLEEQAVRLALSVARALAGAALAERPMAALERAVRECIGHARQTPHLAIRVNEAAVEAVEALSRRLALEGGFAGRIVVLGEPDIAPGDGRIEWADGGFAIEASQMDALVQQAVAAAFGRVGDFGSGNER